ncbi:MAG: YggS family pyridoxal phosphate-dependent enzyme, partial [Oscillospiraceae bacterium]|nr:YggS family pyridoxal phosphate-dependent enzyme [Oscillospiraceae bacterium]
VQEYLSKKDFYDKSAEVNFIGHLQSNKIKYIIDSVTMIHSVDSIRLAAEINKQAERYEKCMDVLIEVNIGREESKSGIFPEQLEGLIYEAAQLKNIRIRGLMTIPPIFNAEESFEKMQTLFNDLQAKRIDNTSIDTLSMGMSSDYALAVKYGSNIVRIGSGLFGTRK